MIYLFDERKDRQEKTYHANDYLGNYSSIIKPIYEINEVPSQEKLMQASCFLLHRSFDTDLTSKLEKIAYDCTIPIVIFTNKDKLINFINANDLEMSAEDFYSRLKDFLQYFQEHQSINLEILAYKNLQIEKIAQIRLEFKQAFFSKKNSETITDREMAGLYPKLKEFYDFLGKTEEDYQKFSVDIYDGEVSKKDFLNRLTNQTTK